MPTNADQCLSSGIVGLLHVLVSRDVWLLSLEKPVFLGMSKKLLGIKAVSYKTC